MAYSTALKRMNSVTSMFWTGEQGPTHIAEMCASAHHLAESVASQKKEDLESRLMLEIGHLDHYGSLLNDSVDSIRFQVVIWSIGPIDVLTGRVAIKFRVTIFWNATDSRDDDDKKKNINDDKEQPPYVWMMKGRNKAVRCQLSDSPSETIDIPQVSILNVVSFDVVGAPEVSQLRGDTKLMRWTCLYNAQLLQDEMRVDNFPHDEHLVKLKLGVLSERNAGERWDKKLWKIALATEKDSQRSTRVPHGVIVDHARIPEFSYNKESGLIFDLVPLSFGPQEKAPNEQDYFLEVKLPVVRDSGYYDKNIVPLLCVLTTVSISFLVLNATFFFQRTLMMLNVSFLEIGIRMSVDKTLPSVGYEIKIQDMMNRFFYSILFLALESSVMYALVTQLEWSVEATRKIDLLVAMFALSNMIIMTKKYYQELADIGKRYSSR